jgi:hypothetical protein
MGYDWFKMHSRGWLTGSIRAQLTPAERSVWADLLAMANESRVRGIVCRAKGIPYTREYIAGFLGITVELLNSTIDKCLKDENADDPNTRIMMDETGCIRIANWEIYQAPRGGKVESQKEVTPPLSGEAKDEMTVRNVVKKPELGVKALNIVDMAVMDKTGKVVEDKDIKAKKAKIAEQQKAINRLEDKGNRK